MSGRGKPSVEQMRDHMLGIMVECLHDIKLGFPTNAEHKMEAVQRWIKVMKSMMPQEMADTFEAIVKELEEQTKASRSR